ncbi:MAG: hypothetical protein ACTJLM_00080 [Ehrlichia sp.]
MQEKHVVDAVAMAILLLCILISIIYLARNVELIDQFKKSSFKEEYEETILEKQSELDEQIVISVGALLLNQKRLLINIKSLLYYEIGDIGRREIIERIRVCCEEYDSGFMHLKKLVGEQCQIIENLNFLKSSFKFYNSKWLQYSEDVLNAQNLLLDAFDQIQCQQKEFFNYLQSFDSSLFPKALPSISCVLHPMTHLLKVVGKLVKVNDIEEFKKYCKKKYNFDLAEVLQQEIFLREQLKAILGRDNSFTNEIMRIELKISKLDVDIENFKKQSDLLSQKR